MAFTVAGVLQAPGFLFHAGLQPPVETTDGAAPLDPWGLASRLSYFLWDSMPDPKLFAAAARGRLATRAQVEAQARRMLEDPRARSAVVDFHHQWLDTRSVRGVAPARRVYGPLFGLAPEPPLDTTGDGDWPGLLGPIRHSMEAEVHLFVERTVFDGDGTLQALLSDNEGYLSAETARVYGEGVERLPGPEVAWDYDQVVFSLGGSGQLRLYPAAFPASERAGLLTLPAVLAVGAYPVHPAPILRGKRILERLACQHFGAPPPGAEAAAPPDIGDAEATNRQRTEEATSPAVCAGCHDSLNPPGFAFENYDAMGRWRGEDNGVPVDASGRLSLHGGETFEFEDGVDLARQLATSDQVRDCYVLRWARYATGAQLEADDEGVGALQGAFRSDDDVKELLVSIAASDLFRHHRSAGADR